MKKKFDIQLMGFITTFERLTGAHAKDIFYDKDKRLVFIVNHGEAGKAIGKKGSNINKLSYMIKKNIKIIEYNDDLIAFVKNIIEPLKADSYELEGEQLVIKSVSKTVKAALIGRDRANLKQLNAIVKRYFPIDVVVS